MYSCYLEEFRIASDRIAPDDLTWFDWNKILPERVSQTIGMPVQSQSGTDTYRIIGYLFELSCAGSGRFVGLIQGTRKACFLKEEYFE